MEGNISYKTEGNNIKLYNKEDNKYVLSYYTEIKDMKMINKIVTTIEKMVRSSKSYKWYIGKLKNNDNLHNCSIYGNINDSMVSVEFHHYPFTLYDIVLLVLKEFYFNNKPISTPKLTSEVLKLHYSSLIGLIPLSDTAHDIVHAAHIRLPLYMVYGNVPEFVKLYHKYMSNDLIIKYNEILKVKDFDKTLFTIK